MLQAYTYLTESQNFRLDLVAGLVCLLAAYTVFSLAIKPAPIEKTRYPWLIAAAVATGSGAWAAYLIMLLGFRPGVPFAFNLGPIVFALVIGIVGSGIGFFIARRSDRMQVGGTIVGLAISGMFYVIMMGVQFSAAKNWDALYVTISLLLGASLGAAALARGHLTPDFRGRLISAVLLAASIMSTYFIGLAALDLTPDPSITLSENTTLPLLFGLSLTVVVMLIIGLGIIGTLADQYVSEIESTKRELEITAGGLSTALKAAEAGNESKARFLATMSHELRTPLNAIIGFSAILEKEMFGPLGGQRYRQYAVDIGESGAHLLHLVNDVLDLSRVDANELRLHDEIIDLNRVIALCVDHTEREAQRGEVQLSVALDPNLPRLQADEHRLRQILFNLLLNAIKFTPSGGQVCVSAYACANGLAIAITDTGIGMAPEDIPKALERFGQLDNQLSRKYEGTGLGLPLAKYLIELHNGTLDIESELGAGTKVTIIFPAERVVCAHEEADQAVA